MQFGEDDVFVREGHSRSVAVDRRDVSHSLAIKIYISTLKGYKNQIKCSLFLVDIGVNEAQVDPAEGNLIYN